MTWGSSFGDCECRCKCKRNGVVGMLSKPGDCDCDAAIDTGDDEKLSSADDGDGDLGASNSVGVRDLPGKLRDSERETAAINTEAEPPIVSSSDSGSTLFGHFPSCRAQIKHARSIVTAQHTWFETLSRLATASLSGGNKCGALFTVAENCLTVETAMIIVRGFCGRWI